MEGLRILFLNQDYTWQYCQKLWSVIKKKYFKKKIPARTINCKKNHNKDIYNVRKDFRFYNKCWCLLNFYPSESSKKMKMSPFHKKYGQKQLFSTFDNVSWAANQYIRMISEGSCDTEDWSNDAENTALITEINYSLTNIRTENSYFKLQYFFHINASLLSIRHSVVVYDLQCCTYSWHPAGVKQRNLGLTGKNTERTQTPAERRFCPLDV